MNLKTLFASVGALALATATYGANSLSVNGGAAIDGSFGLQVLVDGTQSDAYVSSEHPTDETTYTFRFKIDPANFPMVAAATNNYIRIGRAIEVGQGQHIVLFLQRVASGNYRILTWVRWDDNIFRFGTGVFLTSGAAPAPAEVEVTWTQADPGGNNGTIVMTNLTSPQTASRVDIDNDTWEVDTFHWGVFTSPGNDFFGFTGNFDLDSFSSFR